MQLRKSFWVIETQTIINLRESKLFFYSLVLHFFRSCRFFCGGWEGHKPRYLKRRGAWTINQIGPYGQDMMFFFLRWNCVIFISKTLLLKHFGKLIEPKKYYEKLLTRNSLYLSHMYFRHCILPFLAHIIPLNIIVTNRIKILFHHQFYFIALILHSQYLLYYPVFWILLNRLYNSHILVEENLQSL